MTDQPLPSMRIDLLYGRSYNQLLTNLQGVIHFVELSDGIRSTTSLEEATKAISMSNPLKMQFSEIPSLNTVFDTFPDFAGRYGFLMGMTGMELFIRDSWIILEMLDQFSSGQGKATLAQLRKCQETGKKNSGSPGFEQRFREELLQRKIDVPYFEYYQSLKKARNCIVHRNGRVEDKDLETGVDHLSIRWTNLSLTAGGEEVKYGEKTKGGAVAMRRTEVEKTYKAGETIALSRDEIISVLTTIWTLSVQIFNPIQALMRDQFTTKVPNNS